LVVVAAFGAAVSVAGCGGSGGEQVAAASIRHPRDRIAEEQPPHPKHLDVATRAQEKRSAHRLVAEAPPQPKPPAGEPNAPASEWMPPASAGTNGSYSPSSSAGNHPITPRTIARLDREEAEGRAVLLSGIALAPPTAPQAVKAVVSGANEIVGRPYVWGGGHASWYSAGYDCSGAVSYALAAGGFLSAPLASGALESWGSPGPGKWVTVYANAGHAYAVIAGLRWDTVGDARGSGPRWHAALPYPEGFVARHPPGY
jgi:cell wall-associated NlpC family hydrolase